MAHRILSAKTFSNALLAFYAAASLTGQLCIYPCSIQGILYFLETPGHALSKGVRSGGTCADDTLLADIRTHGVEPTKLLRYAGLK